MRGTSHLIVGAAIGAVLADHTGGELLGVTACALGALTPDIDISYSLLGRWFFFWPGVERSGRNGFVEHGRRWFTGPIWHRGQLHSFGFLILSSVIAAAGYMFLASKIQIPALLGPQWLLLFAVCFATGVLSHLLTDCINKSGMMMFWPLSHKLVTAPIPHARENSGEGRLYEMLIVGGAIALAFFALGGSLPQVQSAFGHLGAFL